MLDEFAQKDIRSATRAGMRDELDRLMGVFGESGLHQQSGSSQPYTECCFDLGKFHHFLLYPIKPPFPAVLIDRLFANCRQFIIILI
jgi:hypothetical protein